MCKERLLLFLVLFVLFWQVPLYTQDSSENQTSMTQQTSTEKPKNSETELQNSKENLDNELLKLLNSAENLTTSEMDSMDALTLLNTLENTLNNLQMTVQLQENLLKISEKELLNMKLELQSSKKICQNLKEALVSNKEDTKEIIKVIGELQEKIDDLVSRYNKLSKRNKNAYILGNILIPLPGLMLMTKGFSDIAQGNTNLGITYISIGASTILTFEIVYQSGHWLFKWW